MNDRTMTLDDIARLQKQTLSDLVRKAGSVRMLAFMLDVPVQTVRSWLERGRISKRGAKQVEDHITLGKTYKAVDLRPDLSIPTK